MTQRQFFFIFFIRSKGREREGGRMIAWEFDDVPRRKYRADPMITRLKPALSARIVSRGHPESLT
jgi:hypothetical protein